MTKIYNKDSCPIKFKDFESYEEFNVNDMEKNIYSRTNKKFFIENFKFFELENNNEIGNIKIVNYMERMETKEETNLRIEKEENLLMEMYRLRVEKEEQERLANPRKRIIKGKEIQKPIFDFEKYPIMVKEITANDVEMSDNYCEFSKWIASLLQSIKDMKINDVNNVIFIIKYIFIFIFLFIFLYILLFYINKLVFYYIIFYFFYRIKNLYGIKYILKKTVFRYIILKGFIGLNCITWENQER